MLTLSDIIAIALACKLWSVISDILADFVVKWKNSRKKVDNSEIYSTLKNNPPLVDGIDLIKYKKIPTSPPPPRKRGVIDVNVRVK